MNVEDVDGVAYTPGSKRRKGEFTIVTVEKSRNRTTEGTSVGRTLLSAAFDFALDLAFATPLLISLPSTRVPQDQPQPQRRRTGVSAPRGQFSCYGGQIIIVKFGASTLPLGSGGARMRLSATMFVEVSCQIEPLGIQPPPVQRPSPGRMRAATFGF